MTDLRRRSGPQVPGQSPGSADQNAGGRRLWVLAPVAVAAFVAFLAFGGRDGGADPTPRLAPAFTVEDVRDSARTVSFSPGRPTVVNFFAAWCEPCRRELPALEAAWREHGDTVDFVGVDVADSRTKAVDLLDATGATFRAGYDPHRRVAESYRLAGMPTTVFVGADGRVVGTVQGPLDADDLDRWVDRLREEA